MTDTSYLVVTAIATAHKAAANIDGYLRGQTVPLPAAK